MLSSEYRDRFALVQTAYEVDEWGEQKPVESTVYEGYCKAVNLSGTEFWSAFEQKMESTMKFYCRWSRALEHLDTTKTKLVWRGREFDILSIDNIESRNFDCTIRTKAVE